MKIRKQQGSMRLPPTVQTALEKAETRIEYSLLMGRNLYSLSPHEMKKCDAEIKTLRDMTMDLFSTQDRHLKNALSVLEDLSKTGTLKRAFKTMVGKVDVSPPVFPHLNHWVIGAKFVQAGLHIDDVTELSHAIENHFYDHDTLNAYKGKPPRP